MLFFPPIKRNYFKLFRTLAATVLIGLQYIGGGGGGAGGAQYIEGCLVHWGEHDCVCVGGTGVH